MRGDKYAGLLGIGPAPHLATGMSVRAIMLAVVLAVLPCAVYGVALFGVGALVLMVVSVAASVLGELLFQLATRQKPRVGDLSSVVTGLMLALVVPPSLPPWMMALGALFASVAGKEFFGGLGHNPFNPALAGRAFLMMSFGTAMTTWKPPHAALDAASSATPLGLLKAEEGGGLGAIISSLGGTDAGSMYSTLFLGNRAGSIGETSILLVLIGGGFLLLLRVIEWRVPAALLGSAAFFSWALGMDPLLALLSGGLAFAAFFMATDYSSGPLTPRGRLLYGAAIGLVTVIIRKFGGMPEGVTYAILVMNAVTPFLDGLRQRKYGWRAPPRRGSGGPEGGAA